MRPRPGDLVTCRGGPGFMSLRGSVGLVLDVVELPSRALDAQRAVHGPAAGLACLVFVAGRQLACTDEELEVRARGSKEN